MHETFHDIVHNNPDLMPYLMKTLESEYERQEIAALVNGYIEVYDGIYGTFEDGMTEAQQEALVMQYMEEVFADVYGDVRRGKYRTTAAQKIMRDQTDAVQRATQNRKGMENKNAPPKQRFSLAETEDGQAVAVVDSDILKHINVSEWDDTKKEQAKKAAKNALLAFKYGIRVNHIVYKVNKYSRDEFTRSESAERLANKKPQVFADKMRAADNVDDIITATTSWKYDGGLPHSRTDNFADFAHGKVLIQEGENQYEAETVVGFTKSGEYVFYDVVDMVPKSFRIKKELSITAAVEKNTQSAIQESPLRRQCTTNGWEKSRKIFCG